MSAELDKLIAESEAAIKRLDAIQQRKQGTPIWQRITRHFHKNSSHLINVMLAGSVLAVALGRLAQKHEHQAEKDEWEQQQQRLEAEKQRIEHQAATVLSSTETLVKELEAAAAGQRRDLPSFVQQQVSAWRQQTLAQQQQQLDGSLAAAAAAPGEAGSDGSKGSSKVMI